MLKPLAAGFPSLYLNLYARCHFRSHSTPSLSKTATLLRASSSCSHSPNQDRMESESFEFGQYKISRDEVFYVTQLSYAFVNLRPLVPDVLVCPIRGAKRIIDLTADESSDLWLTAQKIGHQLEIYHKASSLTFGIQDGPEAGQTVPHVHIHILPRKSEDLEKNDEISDAEKESKKKLVLDIDRKDRSREEMAAEADEYRKLFL